MAGGPVKGVALKTRTSVNGLFEVEGKTSVTWETKSTHTHTLTPSRTKPSLSPPLPPSSPPLLSSPIPVARLDQPQLLHDRHPLRYPPENRVLPIQPGRGGKGEEELAAVGIGAGVRLEREGERRGPEVGREI